MAQLYHARNAPKSSVRTAKCDYLFAAAPCTVSPAMRPAYSTKVVTHTINDIDYQIYSLRDRDQFDDPDGLAERQGIAPAMWPIFGMVWPAGLVLAEIMSTYRIAGLKILELGCGLGFASLITNARGGNIIASDQHPLAETFMRENSRINQLTATRYTTCDWNNPITTLGKFDLIIGSDLLYEPHHPALLSRFIDLHASATAVVIIVNPKRKPQAGFNKRMTALGYQSSIEKSSAKQHQQHGFTGKIFTFSHAPSRSVR